MNVKQIKSKHTNNQPNPIKPLHVKTKTNTIQFLQAINLYKLKYLLQTTILISFFFIFLHVNNTNNKITSTNGGFSINKEDSFIKQTTLTTITANKINANIKGNTNLKGALLASGAFNKEGVFIDNKQLNLQTNSLTYENLSNTNMSSNINQGINANINLTPTTQSNNKDNKQINSQTTNTKTDKTKQTLNPLINSSIGINNHHQNQATKTKTLATLGKGNIVVASIQKSDNLLSLNRDTTKLTKEIFTSNTKTNVDATLDTNLLTKDGRKKIAEDAKKASKILDTFQKIATYDDVSLKHFFKETGYSVNQYNALSKLLKEDSDIVQKLANPNTSLEDKQLYGNKILQAIKDETGLKLAQEVKVVSTDEPGQADKQVLGYYTPQTDTIYSNDKNQPDTQTSLFTLGHEIAGAKQSKEGIDITNNRLQHNAYQNAKGQDLVNDIKFILHNNNDMSLASTNNHNIPTVTSMPSVFNTQSNQIADNNEEFKGLDKEKGDNLIAQVVLGTVALASYLNAPSSEDDIKSGPTESSILLPMGGGAKIGLHSAEKIAFQKQNELIKLFSNGGKTNSITIGSKVVHSDLANKGGAKVFKGVSDKDIFKYFKQLTGSKKMPKIKQIRKPDGTIVGNRYTVKTDKGSFNLRDHSKSELANGKKPRWTIDVPRTVKNPKAKGRYEIKFQ